MTPLESKIPEWLSYGVMPIAGFSDQGTKQNPIKNGFFRRKNQVEALVKQVMEAFDGILTSVSYRRGELIHASNATCNSLFIVKSGILRSYYFKDGKDITAHFAMR
ncbi:cyclic nucleotide-binding domain-containing protein [Cyclobacterium salsum]|uniref:cyclic nucleotide-binding domain-containing protein n=1 Tax=Cyclobacterium salsum TaxID=2666329 RepID=UPI001F165CE7